MELNKIDSINLDPFLSILNKEWSFVRWLSIFKPPANFNEYITHTARISPWERCRTVDLPSPSHKAIKIVLFNVIWGCSTWFTTSYLLTIRSKKLFISEK